jgi:energy-coupling factor transport system permease protein
VVPQQVPAELPQVPLLLVAALVLGAAAAALAPVPPLLARSRVGIPDTRRTHELVRP